MVNTNHHKAFVCLKIARPSLTGRMLTLPDRWAQVDLLGQRAAQALRSAIVTVLVVFAAAYANGESSLPHLIVFVLLSRVPNTSRRLLAKT